MCKGKGKFDIFPYVFDLVCPRCHGSGETTS